MARGMARITARHMARIMARSTGMARRMARSMARHMARRSLHGKKHGKKRRECKNFTCNAEVDCLALHASLQGSKKQSKKRKRLSTGFWHRAQNGPTPTEEDVAHWRRRCPHDEQRQALLRRRAPRKTQLDDKTGMAAPSRSGATRSRQAWPATRRSDCCSAAERSPR